MQDFSSYLQVHSGPCRCPFWSVPVSITVRSRVHSGPCRCPFRCQFRSIPASIPVHSSVHLGPFRCPFRSIPVHSTVHSGPFRSIPLSMRVRSGPFLYFHAPFFNPLPADKILDWSKLKQIADDISKCIKNEK